MICETSFVNFKINFSGIMYMFNDGQRFKGKLFLLLAIGGFIVT